MHILTVVGLQYPVVVLSPVWGAKCYLGILSSVPDSCQSTVKSWVSSNEVDLQKDGLPEVSAGTSAMCSWKPDSHGVEPGHRDEAGLDLLRCCVIAKPSPEDCRWEKSAGTAWLDVGRVLRDVSLSLLLAP